MHYFRAEVSLSEDSRQWRLKNDIDVLREFSTASFENHTMATEIAHVSYI